VTGAPLPPLPPLPGAEEAAARPGGRSVLAILAEEHRQLTDLYGLLAAAAPDGDDARLADLTSVLTATLTRHLSAEEQYLYPTVRAVLPDGEHLAKIEVNADEAIQWALRRLVAGPPSDLRGLEEVEPALRLHIRRCEDRLFPRLREVLDETELIRLGNRVEVAEESAPTRPHPGTPYTPPWNKVVEPAVGVWDKVRDAATRRTTHAEDLKPG
jgi:Hemerythrin HHE cation binding domain